MPRLNGWRRLWLFVTAIWLVPVAVLTFYSWPTELDWFALNAAPTVPTQRLTPEELKALIDAKEITAADFAKLYPDEQEIVKKLSPALYYDGIAKRSVVKSKPLPFAERHRRLTFALQMLALWLVPCLGLYVFGSGVAWVRRGFRAVPDHGA